jgi:hypothetical protein
MTSGTESNVSANGSAPGRRRQSLLTREDEQHRRDTIGREPETYRGPLRGRMLRVRLPLNGMGIVQVVVREVMEWVIGQQIRIVIIVPIGVGA